MTQIKSEVKNYNSCPLKKRPIMFVDSVVCSEPEQDEPVNLCVRKVNKEEPTSYINEIRSMPLKDITSYNQQDHIRYAPYKVEESCELYNLLPGYAALNLNTQTSPSPQSASSNKSEEYWCESYSCETSMSSPLNYVFAPSSPPMKITAVHNDHRYAPYVSRHHHYIVDSMSPTHSHSSLDSLSGSSRSSMSPASISSSIEDPYTMMQANVIEKPSDMPRYSCFDCNKSYSTYSGLTKHKQFHCTASPNNQIKKSFDCQICPKNYSSLGALKMHIRTHTKPCKCHLCGKAFSRPWLLQGHIRTHTGDKPFSCQHCHRAFADKSNLRAHLQTHSEIKKYSCTTCSKTFARMSMLTKHMEVGCPCLSHNLNML